jgi:hypothetical protein
VRDSGLLLNHRIISSNPTFLQAKMAQQGKQMRVGARKGFAYHSVKLVLLANGNGYEVDSSMVFLCDKTLYPIKTLP